MRNGEHVGKCRRREHGNERSEAAWGRGGGKKIKKLAVGTTSSTKMAPLMKEKPQAQVARDGRGDPERVERTRERDRDRGREGLRRRARPRGESGLRERDRVGSPCRCESRLEEAFGDGVRLLLGRSGIRVCGRGAASVNGSPRTVDSYWPRVR
ncbi:hypothetical protein C8J57DRAFT_1244541 [Mycena rebaudengoi]|nr:hypothetical protein C8J57DRAFT_1244541 [Mycena rebaudengoi]